ncbi:MAG: chloride channel protein [Clostridia bacterium]|nr:chloride channel protein [Clostridia bacterium]
MKIIKKYALWLLLAILSGAICGLVGAAFSKSVGFVTDIRAQHNWILFLLPLGGLLSVSIYKLCRVKNIGTTNVFDCVRTEQNLPLGLTPAIFLGSCISHLFGSSSGREGAALQIGGGVANTLSHIFKLDETSRHITVMCGMAALFSAVFGTPIAACVFVLEVITTRLCLAAALPVLVSSVTSFIVAQLLQIHPERFIIGNAPQFSLSFLLKICVISLAGILVAFTFCKGLSLGKTFAKKIFKNEFLRIAVGGIIIVILTLLIGNQDYNGGGVNIITQVFEGSVKYEAFALKLLFTVICVSVGYKGGEIIPTLFIGATLGGALSLLLGLPIGVGAAVGMAVLFVSATKCPFATVLLCGEMFGFKYLTFIAPLVIVSFLIARYQGLYNTKDIFKLIKNAKKERV